MSLKGERLSWTMANRAELARLREVEVVARAWGWLHLQIGESDGDPGEGLARAKAVTLELHHEELAKAEDALLEALGWKFRGKGKVVIIGRHDFERFQAIEAAGHRWAQLNLQTGAPGGAPGEELAKAEDALLAALGLEFDEERRREVHLRSPRVAEVPAPPTDR